MLSISKIRSTLFISVLSLSVTSVSQAQDNTLRPGMSIKEALPLLETKQDVLASGWYNPMCEFKNSVPASLKAIKCRDFPAHYPVMCGESCGYWDRTEGFELYKKLAIKSQGTWYEFQQGRLRCVRMDQSYPLAGLTRASFSWGSDEWKGCE